MSFTKFLRRKLLNFFCILLWKQALPSNPSLLWKLWIALHNNSCVATVAVFWESHPEKLKSAVIIKTYIVQDTKMSRIRQNYHEDCEALVNKQINMELYASYVYLSMVSIKLKTIILHWFDAKERSHFNAPLNYIIIPCFQTYYFTRDDVALPGFAKYFQKNSDEEREHAQKFMEYQVINCVLLLHFYDLNLELLFSIRCTLVVPACATKFSTCAYDSAMEKN